MKLTHLSWLMRTKNSIPWVFPHRIDTDEREKKERNQHDSEQEAFWIICFDGISRMRLELNPPITGVKRIRPAGTDRSGAVVAR